MIRCVAYKNGDRDICAQVAAPSVKQLLECCTIRLQLNGAARRMFLDDGSEIFETSEIPRDGDIYVSNGEPFKNPFKPLIREWLVTSQYRCFTFPNSSDCKLIKHLAYLKCIQKMTWIENDNSFIVFIMLVSLKSFTSVIFPLTERHEQKEQMQWTMTGLTLPQGKKKKSKFLLSKRFKDLVTVSNRRVMVYLNGQHTNCQEVITDLKSMEDVSFNSHH